MTMARMKILYISHRLNVLDGSSVHSREFVKNATRLNCVIQSYPNIVPTEKLLKSKHMRKKKNIKYCLELSYYVIFVYMIRKLFGYVPDIINMCRGLIDSVYEYFRLSRLLRTNRPSIIVYRYKLFNFAPYWIARKFNIPILTEVNSLVSHEGILISQRTHASCATFWAERKFIKSSDYLFCVTNEVKKQVDAYKLGIGSCIISNGVDTTKFDPQKFEKKKIIEKLGLYNKIVLGYVGTYKSWHGTETTIELMKHLVKEDRRYHLLMIGNGNASVSIRQLIIKYGLTEYVTQIDQIPHEDVPLYMSAFDFAVMTYPDIKSFHGAPLKFYEYMSMGIPVVVSSIGEFSRIITDQYNGILVYPPSAENFALAIKKARGKEREIGLHGRRLMEKEFTWLENAKQVLTLCERVISNRSASEKKPFQPLELMK